MRALVVFLLSVCLSAVWAEQKVDFGEYELHYIVLNTTEIAPDIAARYNLVRSGKRAMMNLSVLKKTDDGYGQPVTAEITAIERTLLGQTFDIELTEITEGTAIYYIGDFPIIDREQLWFDISLKVTGGPSFTTTFQQQVWRE